MKLALSQQHWVVITSALATALIVAVLILPPWSPLSLTNNEAFGPDPVVQVPPQAGSSLTVSASLSPTPAAERLDLLRQTLSTVEGEVVPIGSPTQIPEAPGRVTQATIPTNGAEPTAQVAATVIDPIVPPDKSAPE